jgi:hypothetical protein
VDIKIRIDPDTADVNVVYRDLSTGERVPLDIGSRYHCILQSYDATAGTHTISYALYVAVALMWFIPDRRFAR